MNRFSFFSTFCCLILLLIRPAQSQDVIFSEDFNGRLPGHWMSMVTAGDSTASEGWNWTNVGPTGEYASAQQVLASTTADNGWMIFDSDLNCSHQAQMAWLISPRINATNYDSITLEFQTSYRNFFDRVSIRVGEKLKNVVTWSKIDLFPELIPNDFGGVINGDPSQNPIPLEIDITTVEFDRFSGSSFYIAFVFQSDGTTPEGNTDFGCSYSWQIDDVKVLGKPYEFDLGSASVYPAPNTVTPISQVETLTLVGSVKNYGQMPSSGYSLDIDIKSVVGTDETLIFTESLNGNALTSGQIDIPLVSPKQYSPPPVAKKYLLRRTVSSQESDNNYSNNERDELFYIIDTLFSKTLVHTIDVDPPDEGDPPPFIEFEPVTAMENNHYSFGNVYYVINGADLHARYISFGVSNPQQLAGQLVKIRLYEWNGDANGDFKINPEEHGGPVALNNYTFTGNEGNNLISVLVSPTGSYSLKDNTYYIAMIRFEPQGDQRMYLQASKQHDFSDLIARSARNGSPRYLSALDIGNTGTFDLNGMGFDVAPVVRLSLGANPLVATKEPTLSEEAVHLFPNPINDLVKLELNLATVSKEVQVVISNVEGRIMLKQHYENLKQEVLTFSLKNYPNGLYFLKVYTTAGSKVKKLVVQH